MNKVIYIPSCEILEEFLQYESSAIKQKYEESRLFTSVEFDSRGDLIVNSLTPKSD